MSYYIPDPTGTDPEYKVPYDVTKLMVTGSVIEFGTTIYATSLVITPFGGGTALVEGTDYQFNDSDRDFSAEAKMAASNDSWTGTLVKSFTVIRPVAGLPLKVTMSYQRFWLNTPDVPVTSSSGTVDFNPNTVMSLVADVAALKEVVAGVSDTAGFTTATPVVLQYDINGTNSANVITDESWAVDTFNNKSVIFPVQGLFFKGSVSVKLDDNGGTDGTGTPLTYGTGFAVYGINLALTAETTDITGIYSLIKILTPYAGNVKITYHGLGGLVTTDIVGQLTNTIEEIKDFLSNSAFLTPGTLKDATLIQTMLQSIQEIQTAMRIQNDGPTYGDSTNGMAVVKQIAANNVQEHWWTIASLYQVNTSSSGIVLTDHDRMLLHIQMTNAKYMADVAITYNRENTEYPFALNVTNVIAEPGFALYGDINVTNTIYPKWRIVTNDDASTFPGAYLQIGMTLPNLTETLTIEDRSGTESTWILNVDTGSAASPVAPMDDAFTLPDGQSVWSSSGGMSMALTKMAQTPTGYMVAAGAFSYSAFDNSAGAALVGNALLPFGFILEDIKRLDLYVSDGAGNRWVVPVAMTEAAAGGVTGGVTTTLATTAQGNMGWLTVGLANGTTQVQYTIKVAGTAATSDNLAIRYIVAYV